MARNGTFQSLATNSPRIRIEIFHFYFLFRHSANYNFVPLSHKPYGHPPSGSTCNEGGKLRKKKKLKIEMKKKIAWNNQKDTYNCGSSETITLRMRHFIFLAAVLWSGCASVPLLRLLLNAAQCEINENCYKSKRALRLQHISSRLEPLKCMYVYVCREICVSVGT